MLQRAVQSLQHSLSNQIQQMYELFDNRNKGYIDAQSLIQGMKSLGYEIDRKQISQMIDFLDQKGQGEKKGVITKESFKKFMTARLDYRDPQEDLKAAFEFFDQDNRGKVTLADLKRVAQEFGQQTSYCQTILKQADKDADGFINYDDFIRTIKKTSYL